MITSLSRLASDCFRFLETSYGFRCVWSTETTVRWESTEVFVQVRYDARRSFEVGLEIDQLAKDTAQFGPPFSLGEVLGLVGVDLAHRPFFQASSEEDLNKALKTMARLLLQDGKQLLLNDGAAFRSLARQRDKDCREYAQNKRLTFMRAAAEKAWHEKDYKAVVDIYQAEMPHLSPAELKRYEIAVKRSACRTTTPGAAPDSA